MAIRLPPEGRRFLARSRLNWTNLAGHVSERNDIVAYIKKRAGDFFAKGNDEIAKEYRMLAYQLESDGKEDLYKLNKLIKQ